MIGRKATIDALAQGVFHVGEIPESANLVKLIGNFMTASMLEALGEAFVLGEKGGVEVDVLLEILNTALFKSPFYANFGKLVSERSLEPGGFKLHLGLKDIGLVLQAAESVQVPMPLAAVVHHHLLSASSSGLNEIDWSSGIAHIIAAEAGLDSGLPAATK